MHLYSTTAAFHVTYLSNHSCTSSIAHGVKTRQIHSVRVPAHDPGKVTGRSTMGRSPRLKSTQKFRQKECFQNKTIYGKSTALARDTAHGPGEVTGRSTMDKPPRLKSTQKFRQKKYFQNKAIFTRQIQNGVEKGSSSWRHNRDHDGLRHKAQGKIPLAQVQIQGRHPAKSVYLVGGSSTWSLLQSQRIGCPSTMRVSGSDRLNVARLPCALACFS